MQVVIWGGEKTLSSHRFNVPLLQTKKHTFSIAIPVTFTKAFLRWYWLRFPILTRFSVHQAHPNHSRSGHLNATTFRPLNCFITASRFQANAANAALNVGSYSILRLTPNNNNNQPAENENLSASSPSPRWSFINLTLSITHPHTHTYSYESTVWRSIDFYLGSVWFLFLYAFIRRLEREGKVLEWSKTIRH